MVGGEKHCECILKGEERGKSASPKSGGKRGEEETHIVAWITIQPERYGITHYNTDIGNEVYAQFWMPIQTGFCCSSGVAKTGLSRERMIKEI